jgi:cytosine/adenosine deaminase-related metal-dependent hydrolase
VDLLRTNGLKLTVGTDSLSSNDDLDMVAELFCLQENFPQVPLGELLTWACRNGAEFLGKETEMGTLAPGKRPGLVLIDHIAADGRLTTASRSYRIV